MFKVALIKLLMKYLRGEEFTPKYLLPLPDNLLPLSKIMRTPLYKPLDMKVMIYIKKIELLNGRKFNDGIEVRATL